MKKPSLFYRFIKISCKIFFRLFFNVEIKGVDVLLAQKTPFIIASNHLSHLDPPLLGISAPMRIGFIAKEELFENKFLGFILKGVGTIPLKRASSDIKAIKTFLQWIKYKPMVIFPQGTRGGSYDKATTGVGFLYRKAKVPMIAAKISGTDRALPKGAKWVRRADIKITYSEIDNITDQDTYQQITEKIVSKLKSL